MFEIQDITHTHLKQFPAEVLQPYVDEGNAMLFDLAGQLGVDPSEVAHVYSIGVKQLIRSYIVFRFSEDSIGVNNVETPESDMYKRMKDEFFDNFRRQKPEVTASVLRGVSTVGRANRAISTGKMVRTS